MIIKKRKVNEKLILNYWYSPDGSGGKKAIKRLNEIANKKSWFINVMKKFITLMQIFVKTFWNIEEKSILLVI